MSADLQTNEEKPKARRTKARTKNYEDAGAPQVAEAIVIPSASETVTKQLDIEATPVEDLMDGGPAPAAPPET